MAKLLRVIKNFSGGLSEVANDNMADNQLVMAQNAVPGEMYGIARASGTSIHIKMDSPFSVKKIVDARFATKETDPETHTERIVYFMQTLVFGSIDGQGNVGFYKNDGGDWTALENTTANQKFIDAAVSGVIFYHGASLFWLNGADFGGYYGDGANILTAAECGLDTEAGEKYFDKMKRSTSVAESNGRWFFGNGSELFFSEVGSPMSLSVSNLININTEDRDTITALHTFNDDLLIFKEHSVFVLSGWDFATGSNINLKRMNVTTGTRFPDSIQTIQNGVLFLGNDGIYKLYVPYYSSQIATSNISEGSISKKLFGEGSPDRVVSAVWDNIYYISVKHGEKTEEYRYHIDTKAYWGPYTQGVRCYKPSLSGDDKLYIGCDNGYILKYDKDSTHYVDLVTGTNAPINMIVKTKAYDVCGAVFQNSKVKKLFVAAKQYEQKSTDLAIQLKADYADVALGTTIEDIHHQIGEALGTMSFDFDESMVWAEGKWYQERWGWTDTVTKQLPFSRKTKHLQFILKSSTTQPLLVYALGILYKRKKVKGNAEGVEVIDVDD